MIIDGGCWLPCSVTGPGNHSYNGECHVPQQPSYRGRQRWARSKTAKVVDKTRANAWGNNMMGNNSGISEWKGNFKLSQPTTDYLTRVNYKDFSL